MYSHACEKDTGTLEDQRADGDGLKCVPSKFGLLEFSLPVLQNVALFGTGIAADVIN